MGAQGTATLDFGAFPGKSDASVAVTGQASIVAGSLVEAWIRPVATADHTSDEHMLETIKVFAADITAGTGFIIYGFNTGQLNEPVVPAKAPNEVQQATATTVGNKITIPGEPGLDAEGGGGVGTRIYGTWTIAWVWN
jgi:hypothetical protein